jgi:phage tail P2-like protein
MANTLHTFKLLDLVPPNLRSDPQVIAAAETLGAELRAVTEAVKECLHLPRLDELPETVIDLLAYQWHVDFYESTLPIEQKRELVRKSISWHRRKGTPDVVQEIVTTVFPDGKIYEWFEYGGQPYKFMVETTGKMDDVMYDKLIRLVNAVKNTRSWLEKIRLKREHRMESYMGIAQHVFKKKTISSRDNAANPYGFAFAVPFMSVPWRPTQ